MIVIPQCSLSCNGGIQSRTVKCVAKQPSQCNLSSRPRSTNFCNLQSCRPRFPPRIPPKIPTQAPGTQTPGYSTTIVPPNISTPITTHTNTSPTSTTSDIIHEDDRDFILVRDGHKDNDGRGAVPKNTKDREAPEDEEGSTDLQPPDKSYTTGYDYIVEDPTGEERARGDDMFTSTPEEVPTSTVRPTTTRAPMHTIIDTTKPTSTSRTQYIDLTTHQCTKTSPFELNTTPKPKAPHLNTQSPQATFPTVKILRKASQTPKGPNKGKAPKALRQRPETANTTDDYGNLNARGPIRRSAFWEVGNWSDVRMKT